MVFKKNGPGHRQIMALRSYQIKQAPRIGDFLKDWGMGVDCHGSTGLAMTGLIRHCERSEAIQGSWIATLRSQ
jgi:hypothetical protein